MVQPQVFHRLLLASVGVSTVSKTLGKRLDSSSKRSMAANSVGKGFVRRAATGVGGAAKIADIDEATLPSLANVVLVGDPEAA